MDARSASMSSQGRDGSAPSLPRVHSAHKFPPSTDSLAGGAPTDGTDSTSRPPPGPPVRKKSLSCSTLPILTPKPNAVQSVTNQTPPQPPHPLSRVATAATISTAPWSARPLHRAVSVGSCLSQPPNTSRMPRRTFHGAPTLCLDLSILTARPRSHAISQEDVSRQFRTFSDFLNDDERENVKLSPSAKCTRWLEHMQLVGGGRCLDDAVYKDAANG